MRVSIVYFAAARELADRSREEVSLPVDTRDIASVRTWLARAHPKLAAYLARMRFAVNGELVRDDAHIAEGDEITVLPPVAGGSVLAEVRGTPLSVDEALLAVRDASAGAVVVFLGTVRDHADGKAVARLDYEAYEALANKEMRRIVDDLMRTYPGSRIAVTHRVGELAIGDVAVIVAASAAHRAEAFAACRATIDRVKEAVPIWKKEWGADGAALWVNLEGDERG